MSDLSAGYLALARSDRPWLLVDALVAASRAVEMAPRDPAGAFNLALALEELSLTRASKRAWQRYVTIEPDPSWRAEGAARLARLRAPTVARNWEEVKPGILAAGSGLDSESVARQVRAYPAEIRRLLETEWLPKAAASLGDPQAKESLAVANLWSSAFARQGDRLYADTVALLETPRTEASARRLAEGLGLYAEGLGSRTDCSRAEPLFARAAALLDTEKSPVARAARLERLVCFYRRLPLVAEPQLARLAAELAPLPYPILAVKTEKMLGLCAMSDGRYSLAIEHYLRAVNRLGAYTGFDRAYLEGMLDEAYRFLGDRDEMWRHRLVALRAAATLGDLQLRHSVLSGLARELAETGRREAALPVLEEMLAIASTWSEPGAEVETLLRRIQLDLADGQPDRAAADIARCQNVLPRFTQPADRAKLDAELRIAAAERMIDTQPGPAREELEAALGELSAKGEGVHIPRALLLLARADLALGDLDRAEEDFRRTLRLYEDRRAFAASEKHRIHYFATAQQSFDAMIRFQAVERHDASAALRYAEQAQARGLRDRLSGQGSASIADLDLKAFLRRLPPDVAAFEFAVLSERLIVWRLYRGSLSMVTLPTPRIKVAQLVSSHRSALRGGVSTEDIAKGAGEAFDALLAPAMKGLPAGTELVLVPDRELHQLAFAALFDRRRGRYLIEDHPYSVTPSLGTYLASLDRPKPKGGELLRVLSVGDPAIDSQAFPTLKTLPTARKEAQAIAALYPASTLLVGRKASRSAILSALSGSDVVHLAAHALVEPREPLASLIVTADPGRAVLRASDLNPKSLAEVNLVFLAACDTAPGFADGDREGVAGLARAFLAAGVSSVVATIWPVDDRAVSGLPEMFHSRLRSGDSPALALQRAQVTLLKSTKPDSGPAWAPFQLFSGN